MCVCVRKLNLQVQIINEKNNQPGYCQSIFI